MIEPRSKDSVLRKVREALAKSAGTSLKTPDFSAPIMASLDPDLSVAFAESFLRSAGAFVYCETEEEFYDKLFELKSNRNWTRFYVWEEALQENLHAAGIDYMAGNEDFIKNCEASLTTCDALIARNGSVLITSATESGRRLSIFPAVHVVVAWVSQLVPDIKDGLQLVMSRYSGSMPSMISLVTGPSRTADIEKTLVRGAHGPKELILFLIDDSAH